VNGIHVIVHWPNMQNPVVICHFICIIFQWIPRKYFTTWYNWSIKYYRGKILFTYVRFVLVHLLMKETRKKHKFSIKGKSFSLFTVKHE